VEDFFEIAVRTIALGAGPILGVILATVIRKRVQRGKERGHR
jgi:hypothetical protein